MIDDIDSSSSTLRLLATQALKTWQTEAIFGLIFDEDSIVRTIAARELQKRGDSSVYPRLISMLADYRDFVREISVFTIGQYGTPTMPFRKEAKLLLTDLLSDTSPEVRASAAAGLGHLCYEEMPQVAEDKLIFLSTTDTESSRPRELPPQALTEPYLKLSLHTALHVPYKLPSLHKSLAPPICGWLKFILDMSVPSLHFHYRNFITTTS